MKKILLVLLILTIISCSEDKNLELQKSFENFIATLKDLLEKTIYPDPVPTDYLKFLIQTYGKQFALNWCVGLGVQQSICETIINAILQALGF